MTTRLPVVHPASLIEAQREFLRHTAWPGRSLLLGLAVAVSRAVVLGGWSLLARLVWWRGRKILYTRSDTFAERRIPFGALELIRGRVLGRAPFREYALVVLSENGASADGGHLDLVYVRTRGVTWCYGWEGEAAEALRTSIMLTS